MPRSAEACQRCRKFKSRCDKARPQCRRCIIAGISCHYTQPAPDPSFTPSWPSTPSEASRRQTRDRAILSCLKCRKAKARCNRGKPCSRCARLGKECSYRDAPPDLAEVPTALLDEHWQHKTRNTTHWKLSVESIKHLIPCSQPDLKSKPPMLNISVNFPLSNQASPPVTLDLPPHSVQKQFIQGFHDTVNTLYHILPESYPPTFSTSSMSDEELAVFYTVLSLGCQANAFAMPATQYLGLPSDLLTTAEAHLHKTPFLLRPSPDSIRTLCLMVIAKQIYGLSCHQIDTAWHLTGIIVRLAVSMALPKTDPSLWALVCLLDMRQSSACGMPLLLRQEDVATLWKEEATPSTAIERLFFNAGTPIYQALQLACSSNATATQVLEVDTALRQLPRPDQSLDAIGTDIFLRQVLLAMHSSCSAFPISHLESALSLLSHQRALCEDDSAASGLSRWLAGFFRHEFFTAAVTMCVHLAQDKGDLDPYARKMMVDALQSCRDIWARDTSTTVCNISAFTIVDQLLNEFDQDNTPQLSPSHLGAPNLDNGVESQ